MRKIKTGIFYVAMIAFFSAIIFWMLKIGANLEIGREIIVAKTSLSQWGAFKEAISHNIAHPLAILLVQIITIIVFARIMGWACQKIGQPIVIGEILAGIMLGPSLFGSHFPELSASLFPIQSLGNLQNLSQIGLIFFMFIVGIELDLNIIKKKAKIAIVVSHMGIIIPFTLGMGLAFYLYQSFAPHGVPFLSFALFLGIAMSIAAFPVLARIVQERGIHKTRLGTFVITCAAIDDITAWCLLAAVIAIVKAGSFVSSLYTILLAIAYVVVMIKLVRPFLKRVGDLHESRENLSKPIVAIFFLALILSAYTSEIIGIHALFGAFMAGAIMSGNVKFKTILIEKVEDLSLIVLLPLFFVYTGLRTEIGLINEWHLWLITGLIIAVAVTGKFFGTALAAKYMGQSWKDSLTIGALMNTRGLMELVVLNIGYDLGILTPQVFAMMVIMALVTTFMTGPALTFINWAFKSKADEDEIQINPSWKYNILVSFGHPERGRSLLRLANGFIRKNNGHSSVTAMHLSPSGELHQYNIEEYEKDSFAPLVQESHLLKQKITTLFKASNDIETDIAETANSGNFDLLMIGVGQSIYEGTILGKILGFTTRIIKPDRIINQVIGKESLFDNLPFDDRLRMILSKSNIAVGIFIDKTLDKPDEVLVPIFTENDTFVFDYATKLIHNSGSKITVIDAAGQLKKWNQTRNIITSLEHSVPNNIRLLSESVVTDELLKSMNLVLCSIESWKMLIETKSDWLPNLPSTLVIADKV